MVVELVFDASEERIKHRLNGNGAKAVGWIEVIVGSMFSGKSEELIRRLRRARIARQKVQVFKPHIDNRYSKAEIVSHSDMRHDSVVVETAEELLKHIEHDTEVVGVDEGQFFDLELVNTVNFLAKQGKRVIIAGLDLDFRAEPFGPVPELLARAESVLKLTAICACCGSAATRTQRLVNGRPAHYDDPIIFVGAAESYEARCRACHVVPKEARELRSLNLLS